MLFRNYDISRIVVGIAPDESAVAEGAEGGALVLAALVGHEGLGEHPAVELFLYYGLYLEGALARMCKGVVHQDAVVDVAFAAVIQGAVMGFQHAPEGREEVRFRHFPDVLFAVHVLCHGVVEGVVVHVTHDDAFDTGIFPHHLHGVVVGDFASAGAEVLPLAAQAGGKVADVEGEVLAVYYAVDHEDVTGAEVGLFLLGHCELDVRAFKSERQGRAFHQCHFLGIVKQADVHAAAVRAVVMHYLVVCICDGGFHHKVFKDVAVLNLGNPQDGVPYAVVLLHLRNDLCHVGEFLAVFCLGPLVCSVREILVVVLAFVVIGVEEVLQIVETYHVAAVLGSGSGRHRHQKCKKDCKKCSFSFHVM